jgi:hypothetical protein
MKHRHLWNLRQIDVVGSWSKRDCPDDTIYFDGDLHTCDCAAMLFVPKGKGLRPVEVEA